uniref:Uncharacterized protein n=1 Tax=viral metagenome TaxID=1070528 RepID=A0A6C0EWY1_9ZZZZ
MSDQSPDEPPKYPKSKEMSCAGCGSLNSWNFRQSICRSHAHAKEAELERKLHSPVVEFVTRPVYKGAGRPQGICELATFMEMLVIPEPEAEELPRGFPRGFDIYSGHRVDGMTVNEFVHHSNIHGRLPALHRPMFNPPSATFPEVVNLTLEISMEAENEIGRRLFEYFEVANIGFGLVFVNGVKKQYYTLRPEFKDTCRFDFKTRFPNLKLLTVIEHSFVEGSLLPLFLLPPSVRVLRTNRNIFAHEYLEFLSNVPRLSDVLIDFIMMTSILASQEPSLTRKDMLRSSTRFGSDGFDLSATPRLRRLRFVDVIIFDKRDPLQSTIPMCDFLEQAHAPPSLESLEFPFSSNSVSNTMASTTFSESEKTFQRLLTNFRCIFPKKIERVDVSFPYSTGPHGVDTWEQKRYIITLVNGFERCYFEDVVSHRLHQLCVTLRNPGATSSVVPRVALENSENLKRNLRMFLAGAQFGLPATFADKVIYQVELRFRDALRSVASELSLSQASLSQMSIASAHSSIGPVEIKQDKRMKGMVGKQVETYYFEALRPKSTIFKQKHMKEDREPRQCGCDTCQIVMNAGIDRDLNTVARLPFSISGIRSMEEYDAIFDSRTTGRGSQRSPRSQQSPRSPSPRPSSGAKARSRSNDEGSPKGGGSRRCRARVSKAIRRKQRHVKRTRKQ